jgi:hypothetical protein
MYANARQLAQGALRLLEQVQGDDTAYDREMAAAILAVQVCDWHYIKTLGKVDAEAADKKTFAGMYPGWDILLAIANGTKHPKPRYPDMTSAAPEEVGWNNPDWWHAPHGRKTLVVEVHGVERSVHGLTHGFCRQFLAATATEDEWEPWMAGYKRPRPPDRPSS